MRWRWSSLRTTPFVAYVLHVVSTSKRRCAFGWNCRSDVDAERCGPNFVPSFQVSVGLGAGQPADRARANGDRCVQLWRRGETVFEIGEELVERIKFSDMLSGLGL